MSLEVGNKAPKFKAIANGEKTIKLEDYKGSWLVLYFYPKDDTSGCTKEACGFNENIKQFEKLDANILGVSPDSVKSHEKFIAKYNLNFDLLSDPENVIFPVKDTKKPRFNTFFKNSKSCGKQCNTALRLPS